MSWGQPLRTTHHTLLDHTIFSQYKLCLPPTHRNSTSFKPFLKCHVSQKASRLMLPRRAVPHLLQVIWPR